MKPEETVDFHFRYTWQAISKMYNDIAAQFGGTMATGFALLSIDLDSGTPSTALGPRMGMEATSLSRLLKSMEEKLLIERKPNPIDGRSVLIHLTELGKEKREDARKAVKQFNHLVFESVDPESMDAFFKVCRIVNEIVAHRKNLFSKA
jgi:DNA-binding MarR family transcriptional regulator